MKPVCSMAARDWHKSKQKCLLKSTLFLIKLGGRRSFKYVSDAFKNKINGSHKRPVTQPATVVPRILNCYCRLFVATGAMQGCPVEKGSALQLVHPCPCHPNKGDRPHQTKASKLAARCVGGHFCHNPNLREWPCQCFPNTSLRTIPKTCFLEHVSSTSFFLPQFLICFCEHVF